MAFNPFKELLNKDIERKKKEAEAAASTQQATSLLELKKAEPVAEEPESNSSPRPLEQATSSSPV